MCIHVGFVFLVLEQEHPVVCWGSGADTHAHVSAMAEVFGPFRVLGYDDDDDRPKPRT